MAKKFLLLFLMSFSSYSWAHCPTLFKTEEVCLRLSENMIFVYDHQLEHNGPFKDFKNSTISSIKADGKVLTFSKLARGLYKIESPQTIKTVQIEILNAHNKILLKVIND